MKPKGQPKPMKPQKPTDICRICGQPVSTHRHPPICDQQAREEEEERLRKQRQRERE